MISGPGIGAIVEIYFRGSLHILILGNQKFALILKSHCVEFSVYFIR